MKNSLPPALDALTYLRAYESEPTLLPYPDFPSTSFHVFSIATTLQTYSTPLRVTRGD